MKAKCVDSGNMRYLTNGKEYEIKEAGIYLTITDDSGFDEEYPRFRFEIIKE